MQNRIEFNRNQICIVVLMLDENCVQCVRLRQTTILIRLLITYFWYIPVIRNAFRKLKEKNCTPKTTWSLGLWCVFVLLLMLLLLFFFGFCLCQQYKYICMWIAIANWHMVIHTVTHLVCVFTCFGTLNIIQLVASTPTMSHEPCIGVSFSMFCLFHLFCFIFCSFAFRCARMHAIFYRCESNGWICTNMLRADGSGGGGGNGNEIVWWMLDFLLFIIFSYCLCFGRVTCTLHVLFNIIYKKKIRFWNIIQ